MKIVINNKHGGFSLSPAALDQYRRETNNPDAMDWNIKRDDPDLVRIVEQLGVEANGLYSNLKVVEIPDNVEWQVDDYDGLEWVAEKHRTWR